MFESLSFLIDVVILAGLGATIFYAYRLSKSLDSFKTYRKEFEGLVHELSGNIEKAHKAIEGMKESSQVEGEKLDRAIREGTNLADELELINETANALAERLEGLAEKSRRASQDDPVSKGYGAGLEDDFDGDDEFEDATFGADPGPSFFIRDREYEEEDADKVQASDEKAKSKAEKELEEALLNKKRSSA